MSIPAYARKLLEDHPEIISETVLVELSEVSSVRRGGRNTRADLADKLPRIGKLLYIPSEDRISVSWMLAVTREVQTRISRALKIQAKGFAPGVKIQGRQGEILTIRKITSDFCLIFEEHPGSFFP